MFKEVSFHLIFSVILIATVATLYVIRMYPLQPIAVTVLYIVLVVITFVSQQLCFIIDPGKLERGTCENNVQNMEISGKNSLSRDDDNVILQITSNDPKDIENLSSRTETRNLLKNDEIESEGLVFGISDQPGPIFTKSSVLPAQTICSSSATNNLAASIPVGLGYPSNWSQSTNPYPFVESQTVLINSKRVVLKYCHTCHIFRPPRSHHCSICDACIEKQDHHCIWLGVCIGRRNYIFFVVFIFSLTLFVSLTLFSSLRQIIVQFDVYLIGLMVISGLILPNLAGLAGYHLYLILFNMTTREEV